MKRPHSKEIKSFTKGFIIASFFSSAFLYAGTLVDGLYQFAGGEVISANEMNQNFQKLHGNVILEATNTNVITAQLDSPAQQCESGNTDCNAGYVNFGNETIGTAETRTDPSAGPIYSATAGGNMSFITIPTDGFYEISLVATPGTFTVSPVDQSYEQNRLSINFAIIKFDSTDNTQGNVTSNTGAMKEPQVDGSDVMYYSLIHEPSIYVRQDQDGDGTEDLIRDQRINGFKKEVYLKANDGIAVFYWIYFENFSTPVNSDIVEYPIGSIKLKVKQVVD